METIAARSTCVAESGGADDHGIFTESWEEVKRLSRGKVALCGSLAKLVAEKRLEEGGHC